MVRASLVVGHTASLVMPRPTSLLSVLEDKVVLRRCTSHLYVAVPSTCSAKRGRRAWWVQDLGLVFTLSVDKQPLTIRFEEATDSFAVGRANLVSGLVAAAVMVRTIFWCPGS